MRPLRGIPWVGALLLTATAATPSHAAWDNIFQACCASCGGRSSSAYYAPGYVAGASPCCPQPCCPQPVCTTQYVQRSYYQPVTCYQTQTYYEPVTTYRTSYYYEPVTSYRYSCYYDPCTCCYQQVACPQTCYRLRSQCCAVQSWVQRCCQVPVTTYQKSCYWEPVTTCCTPSCTPCSAPCNGNGAAAAPAVSEQPGMAHGQPAPGYAQPAPGYAQPAPAVTEQRVAPTPSVTEQPPYAQPAPGTNQLYKPQNGTLYRQLPPPGSARPQPPAPPPSVRLDRIVAAPGGNAQVQGQVVRLDRSPRSGAQLMFVSSERRGPQQTVTADNRGHFQVTLASGGWLVYVHGADGKPVFHSKIDVKGEETRQVTLVSR